MAIACNQICQWNDSSDGCVKPVGKICPMSNMPSKQKPQTNADRIRAMTDEELGQFLGEWAADSKFWKCDGTGECLDWLQQPAEE